MATKKKSSSTKGSERSFVRVRSPQPFFTFKFTHQTIYWLILSLLFLGLGAWVLTLTVKVQTVYDQVEFMNSVQHKEHTN